MTKSLLKSLVHFSLLFFVSCSKHTLAIDYSTENHDQDKQQPFKRRRFNECDTTILFTHERAEFSDRDPMLPTAGDDQISSKMNDLNDLESIISKTISKRNELESSDFSVTSCSNSVVAAAVSDIESEILNVPEIFGSLTPLRSGSSSPSTSTFIPNTPDTVYSACSAISYASMRQYDDINYNQRAPRGMMDMIWHGKEDQEDEREFRRVWGSFLHKDY